MKALKDCKILVTPTSFGSQDPDLKINLEAQVGEVIYNTTGKPLSSQQLQEMLPGVDGLIAGLDVIDAAALDTADQLKVIARYGVGVNNVDLAAASEKGIVVTNTPGANAVAVAELTVALILDMLRPILPAAARTKSGDWPRFKGYSLKGKVIGLLGLGAIGKESAKRLSGFVCRILAYDIDPDKEFAAENGIELVGLDELLSSSDVISLHLPGTPETVGIVNDEFISKMKDGAWLVNTARGDLIVEESLLKALESGKLRGAALDVYSKEPPDRGNPLLKIDQVIATPHMGAHADSATNAMGWMALEECLAVLSGKPVKYKVN
jgi:D-3-phosphoglycerate dehydrogenase